MQQVSRRCRAVAHTRDPTEARHIARLIDGLEIRLIMFIRPRGQLLHRTDVPNERVIEITLRKAYAALFVTRRKRLVEVMEHAPQVVDIEPGLPGGKLGGQRGPVR